MLSEEQKQFNREVIAKQHAILERNEWHSCGNCTHLRFTGTAAMCALYKLTQPIPVLITGCESWEGATPF